MLINCMRLTSQILEVRLLLCPFILLVWGSWLYFKGSTLFNSWSISSKYLQKYIHKQQKKIIFCVEIIITLTINNTIRNCNIEIFRFIVSFFRTRVGFLIARSTCPCTYPGVRVLTSIPARWRPTHSSRSS